MAKYRTSNVMIRLPESANLALSTAAAKHGLTKTDILVWGASMAMQQLEAEQSKDEKKN